MAKPELEASSATFAAMDSITSQTEDYLSNKKYLLS
jgi:hypothetical protein